MKSILYVTSFSPDLYAASGRGLLDSFLQHRPEGRLLVCGEQGVERQLPTDPLLAYYDLDQSTLLRDWLARNADIIPEHLGGNCRPCGCPGSENMHSKKHKPLCPGAYFNRNASRWFRKVVAIQHARRHCKYEMLVWLDADCLVQHHVPATAVTRWFNHHDCFYLRSPKRKVLESGIIGFRASKGAQEILDDLVQRYVSGAFRTHARWDDAYQFQVAIVRATRLRRARVVDLARDIDQHGGVVAHSPLRTYFVHDKGKHSRGLGIFK